MCVCVMGVCMVCVCCVLWMYLMGMCMDVCYGCVYGVCMLCVMGMCMVCVWYVSCVCVTNVWMDVCYECVLWVYVYAQNLTTTLKRLLSYPY